VNMAVVQVPGDSLPIADEYMSGFRVGKPHYTPRTTICRWARLLKIYPKWAASQFKGDPRMPVESPDLLSETWAFAAPHVIAIKVFG